MKWKDCYSKVQALSPKAAKLAARLLRRDARVPVLVETTIKQFGRLDVLVNSAA